MRTASVLLACLALASALTAQPVGLNLVMPNQAVTAGAQATVELAILNRSASEQVFTPPVTLPAKLTSGGNAWPIELHATSTAQNLPHSVPPGEFATITYSFALPAGTSGIAIIEALADGFAPVRGVIEILAADIALAARPESVKPAERTGKPVTNLARAEPAASIIQRTFANRLAPHESIYFIYGPDAPAAKFQFSFKYRLLNFTELSRKRMSRTLQFGFTQRSLWDMEAASSPFYDTSYMPELMFESLAARPEAGDRSFTWLGYQAAFKHESNGRDGAVSRSLNTIYIRPAFAFGKLDGWHLLVLPELFTYLTSLENNPDLKAYRGYGQLRLALGRNDGPTLLASLWAGRKFEHQSIQLDLTLPIRTRLLNFETYALIQYFNGYGESLLSYQAKSETIRAGFSLVR